MFGTLKLSRCEAPSEYQRYRQYYCGLCSLLSANYGQTARMFLNYDITFFYILLNAITASEPRKKYITCPVAPHRRRQALVNEETGALAAAVDVYLTGLKLRDDIRDEGKLSKKAMYRLVAAREARAAAFLAGRGVGTVRAEELFFQQDISEREGGSLAEFYGPTEEGLRLLFSEAAHRERRHNGGCCCPDDLCTAWICCDAADCDCDTAEGCAQGDCCEFMECCG